MAKTTFSKVNDSMDSQHSVSRLPPAPSSIPTYYSTPDRFGSNGMKYEDSFHYPLSESLGMRSEKKRLHSKRASNVNQAVRREWGAQIIADLKIAIDEEYLGLKRILREWKYLKEVNQIHTHLFFVIRRNVSYNAARQRLLEWHWLIRYFSSTRRWISRISYRITTNLLKSTFAGWSYQSWQDQKLRRKEARARFLALRTCFLWFGYAVSGHRRVRIKYSSIRDSKTQLLLTAAFDAFRSQLCKDKSLRTLSLYLGKNLLSESVQLFHSWRDFTARQFFLECTARKCEMRWQNFMLKSFMDTWKAHARQNIDALISFRRASKRSVEKLLRVVCNTWSMIVYKMRCYRHAHFFVQSRLRRSTLIGTFQAYRYRIVRHKELHSSLANLLSRNMHRSMKFSLTAWDWAMVQTSNKRKTNQLVQSKNDSLCCDCLNRWCWLKDIRKTASKKVQLARAKISVQRKKRTFSLWYTSHIQWSGNLQRAEAYVKSRNLRLCQLVLTSLFSFSKSFSCTSQRLASTRCRLRWNKRLRYSMIEWRLIAAHRKGLSLNDLHVQFPAKELHFNLEWREENIFSHLHRIFELKKTRQRLVRSQLLNVLDLWLYGHLKLTSQTLGSQIITKRNLIRVQRFCIKHWRAIIRRRVHVSLLLQKSMTKGHRQKLQIAIISWKHFASHWNRICNRIDSLLGRKRHTQLHDCFMSLQKNLRRCKKLEENGEISARMVNQSRKLQYLLGWKFIITKKKRFLELHVMSKRKTAYEFIALWRTSCARQSCTKTSVAKRRKKILSLAFSTWQVTSRKSRSCVGLYFKKISTLLLRTVLEWHAAILIQRGVRLHVGVAKKENKRELRMLALSLASLRQQAFRSRQAVGHLKVAARRFAMARMMRTFRELRAAALQRATRRRHLMRVIGMHAQQELKFRFKTWRHWIVYKQMTLCAIDKIVEEIR
uniref:Sfi1 spindle body domain-containing protein n=1 Tax=Guillardia theta TaxID=55529 RepID=A0A7S4K5H8_GUITH